MISYRKLIIYDIKKPQEVTSNLKLLTDIFKSNNKINIGVKEWYKDKLDDVYKVIYYDNTNSNYFELVMACVKTYIKKEIDENGIQSECEKEAYDTIKIFINFDNNKIFLFYDDINISPQHTKDITHRKTDFIGLFNGNLNKNSLLKYSISDYLNKYTKEYLKESPKSKKLIQTIELDGITKKRSKTKTSESDFNHNKHLLEGIKEKLSTNLHIVNILECKINNSIVRFKHDGEIHLFDYTFKSEVIKDVSREIFSGSDLFKLLE